MSRKSYPKSVAWAVGAAMWILFAAGMVGLPLLISKFTNEEPTLKAAETSSIKEQYSSKQECVDAGIEGSVHDEDGVPVGSRRCNEDGTYTFISDAEQELRADRAAEQSAAEARAAEETCNIKGNISYNGGEKIYHVPSDPYYDETVINTDYGERWFCSTDAAEAAGWRPHYAY